MTLVENEGLLRTGFFVGGLSLFWVLGVLYAYRKGDETLKTRWLNNIGLTIFNTLVLRLLLPTGLIAVATFTEVHQFGLFNIFKLPVFADIAVAILIFDLVIYFQHVVFHRITLLWRLHRVHHTDTGFDATTALRFHPLEILISTTIKAFVIVIFGISAVGVLIFEILLNFSALFNHSNFSLMGPIEKSMRSLFVTPDMHRIHHSIRNEETNSNFGFCLSWWDRIFKTYRESSSVDLKVEPVGQSQFRNMRDQSVHKLLMQPFSKDHSAD